MEAIIKGKIIDVFETKQFSEKFSVRKFGIETDEKYPSQIEMQCINGACDTLDVYNPGDNVVVTCRVGGRKNNNRYFNSLTVTSIKHNIE